MSTSVNFRIKVMKKKIRLKTDLLKLEFYNSDRKMRSTIRCIFISIIMHPNFLYFCQKVSFKSELEIFTPVSKHSKIALNQKFTILYCRDSISLGPFSNLNSLLSDLLPKALLIENI